MSDFKQGEVFTYGDRVYTRGEEGEWAWGSRTLTDEQVQGLLDEEKGSLGAPEEAEAAEETQAVESEDQGEAHTIE